jgi:hypothetical protein
MTLGLVGATSTLVLLLAQAQSPHTHHQPAPTLVAGGWAQYRHKTAGFTFEHPAEWSVLSEKQGISIHISHPTKAVHLFAAAFTMPEGTLQAFADEKFATQREIFKPLGPPRAIEGEGWTGLVEDADASEGGEKARRRMLCAKHGDLFVSLTLYIDPSELGGPDGDYGRVFTSLRFDGGGDAPASTPPSPR